MILTLIHYFLFCTNIIRWKKIGLRRKRSLPIFPLTCKKSGLELTLAQAASPLGNLAARQSWPAKRASLAHRESATWRGNLKRELRSCRGLREKGSKQELPRSDPNLSPIFTYYMNLTSTLNKGTVQRNVYSVQYIRKFWSKIAASFISDISYSFKILESSWTISSISISSNFSMELIRLWTYRRIILRSISS